MAQAAETSVNIDRGRNSSGHGGGHTGSGHDVSRRLVYAAGFAIAVGAGLHSRILHSTNGTRPSAPCARHRGHHHRGLRWP